LLYSIKSHAKVNIFLKITEKKSNGYHNLISRFMKVTNLYDEMIFEKKENHSSANSDLIITGNLDCPIQQNIIYKAYKLLIKENKIIEKKLNSFFSTYKINIKKNIPVFAGLGGGSSNCATFLISINKLLNLNLTQNKLLAISNKLGSDIAFFIYNFNSANVYNQGEKVELFEEDSLDIKVNTPQVQCSTIKVYNEYDNLNLPLFTNSSLQKELSTTKSSEILKNYDSLFLNDLYKPALNLYPKLKQYKTDLNYFSGSGSSFFTI
jgi:4-diphosphocytidyl-2-C-methyl-D-erythritol kinase